MISSSQQISLTNSIHSVISSGFPCKETLAPPTVRRIDWFRLTPLSPPMLSLVEAPIVMVVEKGVVMVEVAVVMVEVRVWDSYGEVSCSGDAG